MKLVFLAAKGRRNTIQRAFLPHSEAVVLGTSFEGSIVAAFHRD